MHKTRISRRFFRSTHRAVHLTGALLLIAGSSVHAATPKAVFILFDGIPADLVESVSTSFFDEIARDGGYARAYVGGQAGGASESRTVSAVGYNSVLTGTWANKHRVYSKQIRSPDYRYWNIFRLVKQHNLDLNTALNEHFGNLPGIVDILPSILTHLEVAVPQAVSEQFDGKSFIDARRPREP